MNVLVIGSGQLARWAAETLDREGHAVSVLDADGDSLSLLNNEFQGVASVGFPMDLKSLRNAGIEGCDAVAVVTADDNLNITVGQIARNYFHIPRVIVRISDPRRETVFEEFGLQSLCPTKMAGEKLVSWLKEQENSYQVNFGVSTVSLIVEPAGRRERNTDELEPEPGVVVFGVLKKDGRFQLLERRASLPLEEGDAVVYSRMVD